MNPAEIVLWIGFAVSACAVVASLWAFALAKRNFERSLHVLEDAENLRRQSQRLNDAAERLWLAAHDRERRTRLACEERAA